MTTIALTPHLRIPAAPLARRVGNAMRLHVANPWPTLITPWLIFAAIFALNYAIWQVVTITAGGRDQLDPDAFAYNGGGFWIFFFLMGVAIQAMSLTFRFALGLGMTRRDYYLGTVAFLSLLGAGFATGITLLAQVEDATDGWGIGGRIFGAAPLGSMAPLVMWWVMLASALLLAFIGVVAATMWVRWRTLGLYGFFLASAVLLVGGAWLMSVTESWGTLADYLGTHSPALSVTWTLPATLVLAVLGYLVLRRATPRA